jgi:hypothetical protein
MLRQPMMPSMGEISIVRNLYRSQGSFGEFRFKVDGRCVRGGIVQDD